MRISSTANATRRAKVADHANAQAVAASHLADGPRPAVKAQNRKKSQRASKATAANDRRIPSGKAAASNRTRTREAKPATETIDPSNSDVERAGRASPDRRNEERVTGGDSIER